MGRSFQKNDHRLFIDYALRPLFITSHFLLFVSLLPLFFFFSFLSSLSQSNRCSPICLLCLRNISIASFVPFVSRYTRGWADVLLRDNKAYSTPSPRASPVSSPFPAKTIRGVFLPWKSFGRTLRRADCTRHFGAHSNYSRTADRIPGKEGAAECFHPLSVESFSRCPLALSSRWYLEVYSFFHHFLIFLCLNKMLLLWNIFPPRDWTIFISLSFLLFVAGFLQFVSYSFSSSF